ncbi:MAG: carbohydrate-binding family 9-like protein, partial [Gemmatimonadales bacterium]
FEMFIDPSGSTHRYVEIELNQFGTVWDLMLTKPYRDGGKAVNEWDIDGLRVEIGLDGTLNDARDRDRGWTVEMAIPWAALSDSGRNVVPPPIGEQWRVNFSRVQWDLASAPGGYSRRVDREGKRFAEHNWVWSPQGVVNMHLPELWGIVQFGGTAIHHDAFADAARWDLRRVYYAQRDHRRAHDAFASTLEALGLGELSLRVRLDTRNGTWHARTIDRQLVWQIDADGRVFHD